MTMFSYDFTETEEGLGDFVTLTPGRYVFKFTKAEQLEAKSGAPMAKVYLQVSGGSEEYLGGVITQHWVTSGAGAFRWREFLTALGIDLKERGKINVAKFYDQEIGARVSLKLGTRLTEAGDEIYFHELRGMIPGDQMRELLDEFEETEEETEEVEEVDDDGDENPEESDTSIDVEDLAEMGLKELRSLAEELELDTEPDEGKSRISSAVLRSRITEYVLEADDDETGGDDGDGDDDDELTIEDIEDMGLKELKTLAKEYEVSLTAGHGKRKSPINAAALRAKIIEELFENDEDDDGEAGGEDDDEEEPF